MFTGDQTIHPWPNCSSVTKPVTCDQTVHLWPNRSQMTKLFTHDQTIGPYLNRSFVTKLFTINQTFHPWPNLSPVTTMTKLFTCDEKHSGWSNRSHVNKLYTCHQTNHPLPKCRPWPNRHRFNVILLFLWLKIWCLLIVIYCLAFCPLPKVGRLWPMIVTIAGGPLYYTSWDRSIIVTLPGALYAYDTSWVLYDCGTSCGLYDYGTSLGLSMIVTLPWAPLWVWHFLGLLYDCDTSSMIVIQPVASLW